MSRQPVVYIMANKHNGTLYTGVTSDLSRRVYEHREGLTPGFTTRYGCKRLVYYERYERIVDAIAREKQIKGGSRAKKIALIEAMNPGGGTFMIPSHDSAPSCRAEGEAIPVAIGLLRLRLAMTQKAPPRHTFEAPAVFSRAAASAPAS